MSKHTPGPWYVRNPEDVGTCRGIVSEPHQQGLAYTCGLSDPTDLANAHLIAAAPELLDALNVCLGWLTGGMDGDWRDCNPSDLARKAIAKAEGK